MDRQGRLLIEGLTPIGTTAFSLFAQSDEVLLINDLQRKSWTGRFADIASILPLFAGEVNAREIGLLLLGLPPPSFDRARFDLGSRGLSHVRIGGAEAHSIRYDPPQFPPGNLSLVRSESSGAPIVRISLLDIESSVEEVGRPMVPSGYGTVVDAGELLQERGTR